MSKMLVLMSHSLTEDQKSDAVRTFGINEFIQAPKEVLDLWGNVPPELGHSELEEYLKPVYEWIEKNVGNRDIVMVQGEMTSTYLTVRRIKQKLTIYNVHCVAATSRREVVEETLPDGSVRKTAVFRHVRFRTY
jgi:hypothetical protein